MRLQEINILAMIIAALAGAIVGFLWYAFFPKGTSVVVEEELGIKKLNEKPSSVFLSSFIANLASAFALAWLFKFFNSRNFLESAKIAGAVWLAFVIVSFTRKILIEKKSWKNFVLGAGHDFVSLAIMVAVMVAWK